MSTNGESRDMEGKSGMAKLHAPAIAGDLKAYADGELSALRRWQIRRHLSGCANCRKEITGLNRVSEEMRNLPQAMPSPELRARILASLPDAPPAMPRPDLSFRSRQMAGRLSLAGVTCALLLISIFTLARHQAPDNTTPPAQTPDQSGRAEQHPTTADGTAANSKTQDATFGNRAATSEQAIIPTSNPAAAETSVAMTDPTSIEADRILLRQQRQGELDRAIMRARKLADRRQELADAQARRDRAIAANVTGPSLQFAVADVAAAQERLRSLVQNVGGSLTSPIASTVADVVSGPVNSPHSSGNHGNPANMISSASAVISISVPAAHISHFETALREIGVSVPWKSEAPGPSAATITPGDGALPVPKRLIVPRADAAVQPHGPDVERTPLTPNRIVEDHPGAFTIYTIRLQSTAHTAH